MGFRTDLPEEKNFKNDQECQQVSASEYFLHFLFLLLFQAM
jgi:hypothetical protein